MNRCCALITLIAVVSLTACRQPVGNNSAGSAAAGGSADSCPAADQSGNIEIAKGLTAKIIKTGYGRAAIDGDYADTNVWLWQLDETAEDKHGAFVWESGDSVFQFQLGAGQVIKGWDMGVPCMLEGEVRELVVSPRLAYGRRGRDGFVPPNTSLIFTIELLKLASSE
jgi:peptidylprolyl isomerase